MNYSSGAFDPLVMQALLQLPIPSTQAPPPHYHQHNMAINSYTPPHHIQQQPMHYQPHQQQQQQQQQQPQQQQQQQIMHSPDMNAPPTPASMCSTVPFSLTPVPMSSIPPNLLWDAVARQAAGNSFLTPAPQAPASTMPSFPPFPFFPMPPSHQPIVFNNQPPYSPFPSPQQSIDHPPHLSQMMMLDVFGTPKINPPAIDLESDHEQHQQLRAPWNGTFPSPDPQMTQTPPSSWQNETNWIKFEGSPSPLAHEAPSSPSSSTASSITPLPTLSAPSSPSSSPPTPTLPKPVARRPKSPIESTKKKASPILGPNQMLKRTGVVALIRHRCPHCQKPFSRKSHLLSHLVIHTDRRDYVCKQCPATFARPHDLQRHLKTAHSEMREFECPKCGVACKRKDSLGKHLLFHCKGVKNGSGGEEETEDDE